MWLSASGMFFALRMAEKMRRGDIMKRTFFAGLALLVFYCPSLLADTLAFDPSVWNLPLTINGEPIGPYPMHLNGSTAIIDDLWCMTYQQSPDWNDFEVKIDAQNYGAQAYILSMLGQYGNQTIQWALWIYDTTHMIDGKTAREYATEYLAANPTATWISDALSLADSADANKLTSGCEVYVDQTGQYQNMIHEVPEPSVIILLGIGLGAAGLCMFRSKARQ
jgi:hypothetical protein